MNLVKALGVGALSLMAIGGLRLIGNLAKKAKLPSKQQTLLILEDTRKEYYPVLIKIANLVTKQLMPNGVNPQDNEKLVLDNPSIKADIEEINSKIYSKYCEQDVKQAIQTLYKQDGDIIKQRHEFREEYKKSLMGIKPDEHMIVSRKISKEKTLEVVKTILNEKINRLEDVQFIKMDQSDQHAFLELDIEQDQKNTKTILREQLGLCASDSINIFHYVVAQYNQEDERFRAEYDLILEEYNEKIKEFVPKV